MRKLVAWAREHVALLPGKNPETFVWEHMIKDADTAALEILPDAKQRFKELARKELGKASYEHVTSQEILGTQLRRLTSISDSLPELQNIHQRLSTAATTS